MQSRNEYVKRLTRDFEILRSVKWNCHCGRTVVFLCQGYKGCVPFGIYVMAPDRNGDCTCGKVKLEFCDLVAR